MSFNPTQFYEFGKSSGSTNNTFIGGVASTINTPALLAAKLSIAETDIQNFTIVGNNIECYIDVNYYILGGAFQYNSSIIYYKDLSSLITSIGVSSFRLSSITEFYSEGVLKLNNLSFQQAGNLSASKIHLPNAYVNGHCTEAFRSIKGDGTELYLPGITNIDFSASSMFYGFNGVVNIQNCISMGISHTDSNIFSGINSSATIVCHNSLATINSGSEEADLAGARSLGATIVYKVNLTIPNAITDLAVNTNFSTAIKLSWTEPTSLNGIDFYEIYVDGVLNTTTSNLNVTILDLTNLQTYNFTVIAVDNFYNKSLVSNTVTQQINGVGTPIPTENITSYFKFENNVLDSVGTNDGTATSITYVVGKINNAAVFNGSTSKIQLPTTILSTTEFSISFFVKLNSTASEQRIVSLSNNVSGAYTSIRLNSGGVANLIGAFVYDGVDGTPKTVSGYDLTTWTHIVLTAKSNDNYKLYVNGALGVTDSTFGNFGTVAGDNYLGTMRTAVSNWVNGNLDSLVFWNKELSQEAVIEIYNKQNAGLELI